ncbi:uncharacterized membrane protein (DUF485 family) [Saccharothrix tamanrassetensis]|uniref:Uncharacterized membrane protein (DUF485 family) n=1 Tax=Saccharothrix tamanrassetensis TaxID=1051531 RepID=A0A841CPC8_9PSEU|nr:DUF485 domain-containing protein [Saccharothrix tamanrassetensis]MBB5959040.1 uncharacterized membrane protein (DUF485 family) [Saccharothrix tamanrassetensis]
MAKAILPPTDPGRARGFATFEEPGPPLLVDEAGRPDYAAIRDSADFRELRRRTAVFVLPATLGFLAWYLGYVALSAYLPEFMGAKVYGMINVGMVFGLLQFVTTIGLTLLYSRYARRRLDPQVAAVRALTAEERA